MNAGLHHGIDIEAYHSGAGISKSGIDDINQSPLHYYARHLDPKRPREPERAGDQLAGALLHCALLEPGEFSKRYAVGPDVSRATKAWKEFVEGHPGMTCIKPDQQADAYAQAASIRTVPELRTALARGEPEVSAYWNDGATGELCRCRPDWVSPLGDGEVLIIDAKTYSSAAPSEFARQIARMRYHVQAVWYSDGYERASGQKVIGFVFAAVELKWPFAASAVMLDEESIEQGRREARRDLDIYAECRRTSIWPGYSSTIETVSLPK